MKRALFWIAGVIGGVIILVIVAITIAVNTPSIARKVIALGLKHAPPGLTIGTVRGRLRGPLELRDVRYRSPGLTVAIDRVDVDWHLTRLLARELDLTQLHVTGVRVVLADTVPADTTRKAPAKSPPHLPLRVHLGDVAITTVRVHVADSVDLAVDTLRASGWATDYVIAAHGSATVPQPGALRWLVHGKGTLTTLALDSLAATAKAGRIAVRGNAGWWPAPQWKVTLAARDVVPSAIEPGKKVPAGVVSIFVRSSGKIDSTGPDATLVLDSLTGALRRQRVAGNARVRIARHDITFDTLALRWGTAQVALRGSVAESLDMKYAVSVSRLAPLFPGVAGSAAIHGAVSGTRTAPHIRIDGEGSRLAVAKSRVAQVTLHGDVDLARGGVIALIVKADSAVIGANSVTRAQLAAHGTREAHRIALAARSTRGNVVLALRGGYDGTTWSGTVDTMRVDSSAAGSWRLAHPTVIVASARAQRIDTLCVDRVDSVVADTTRPICLSGAHAATSWSGALDAPNVPLSWIPARMVAAADSVTGSVALHVRARGTGSVVRGEARIATANVTLVRRREKKVARLALDSASFIATLNDSGLAATMALRASDGADHSIATVDGSGRLPTARSLRASALRGPLNGTLDAHVTDFARMSPFLPLIDSIAGSSDLTVTLSGTAATPSIDAHATIQQARVQLAGDRTVTGGIDLTAKADKNARTWQGTVRLRPQLVRYAFPAGGRTRTLAMNGEGITLASGTGGAHAKVNIAVTTDSNAAPGTLDFTADLPQYGSNTPLKQQSASLRLAVDLPDLSILQAAAPTLDTLTGRLHFAGTLGGRFDAPDLDDTLQIDSLRIHLPSSSTLTGGVAGTAHFAVAASGAIDGRLQIAPVGMVAHWMENNAEERVSLDSSRLLATAGTDGVHGTLDLVFASASTRLGAMHGALVLPHYTRTGTSLRGEEIHGTLTGDIPDLSFVRAFAPAVDSAAGAMHFSTTASGTVAHVDARGTLAMHHAAFRLTRFGTAVDSVELAAQGDRQGGVTLHATMRSPGGGRLAIDGTSPATPTAADRGHVHIAGDSFQVANSAQLRALISPRIDVTIGQTVDVTGAVRIPLAHLVLAQLPEGTVTPSDDVVLIDTTAATSHAVPIRTSVQVTLGDSVTFSGFNFNARLTGGLRVDQEPHHLATASGGIVIDSGTYQAYGQDLTIQNGRIQFAGGPIDNPALDIRASRTAEDSVVAGLDIKGTLKQPQVTIFSEPPMTETEALSYIVTGHGVGQGTGSSGNLISKALSALGLKGGNAVAGVVGHELHLDEARIEASGDIKKASFVAGSYLSPNVYVSYGIGLFDPVSTLKLRYIVSSHFTLQAETGQTTSGDVLVKTSSH